MTEAIAARPHHGLHRQAARCDEAEGSATASEKADELPARSECFGGDGPGPAPHLAFPGPLARSWAYGDGSGRGVRVAVVDSGVEVGHVSVRVLGANLKGGAFAHGLDWFIENGVQVVNLSLATANEDYAETFWELLDQAAIRRIMVVSAMNNERTRTIPREFAGVFSVACTPGDDRERVVCNPAGPADRGAPGIDVDVAWRGGRTMTATGNSFAAPVVAGLLARIVTAHPGITAWQARTVLAAMAAKAPVL